MGRMYWSRLTPPVLAAVAFAIAAATAPSRAGAADPPWDAPACDGTAPARVAAERASGAIAGGTVGRVAGRLAIPGVPWFRVDPVLDRRGTLIARRVASGDAAAGSRRRFDMAPESFVAGPFGRVLLVGFGRRTEQSPPARGSGRRVCDGCRHIARRRPERAADARWRRDRRAPGRPRDTRGSRCLAAVIGGRRGAADRRAAAGRRGVRADVRDGARVGHRWPARRGELWRGALPRPHRRSRGRAIARSSMTSGRSSG